MRRREFITLLGGAAAWPLAARAQQRDSATRVNVVGVIAPLSFSAVDGLRQGFHELGYVEGQNLHLEYRWAEGSIEQYAALVFELIQLGAAAIVVYGTPATLAAKKATARTPIVMAAMGDPVGTGVVSSLARPGGNITGFTSLTSELEPKRLEILKETLPHLSQVGMLWNSANSGVMPNWIAVRRAAGEMGLTVDSGEVREHRDFETIFQRWRHNRPDGVLVLTDPVLLSNAPRILSFMADQRLPAVYSHRTDDKQQDEKQQQDPGCALIEGPRCHPPPGPSSIALFAERVSAHSRPLPVACQAGRDSRPARGGQ